MNTGQAIVHTYTLMKIGVVFTIFAPIFAIPLHKTPINLEKKQYVQMNTPNSNQLKIFHQDTAMISWNFAVPVRYVVKYDIYLNESNNQTQLLGKKLMTDSSFLDSSHNSPDIKLVEMTKNDIIISNVTSRLHEKSLLMSLVMIDEDSNMVQKNETIIKFVVFRKPELSCIIDSTKSFNATYVILCECISQPAHQLTYDIEPSPNSHKINNVTAFQNGQYISKSRIILQFSTVNDSNYPFVMAITASNVIDDEIYSTEKYLKLNALNSTEFTAKMILQPFSLTLLALAFVLPLILIIIITISLKVRSKKKAKIEKSIELFEVPEPELSP